MGLVHAVVRAVMSPDAAGPLDQFQPEDPQQFSVFIEFEIGPNDRDGADLFGLTVCSPQSLVDSARPKGYEFLHAVLVVDRWDIDQITSAVSVLCSRTSGPDWPSIAESLSRSMAWEYADYSA